MLPSPGGQAVPNRHICCPRAGCRAQFSLPVEVSVFANPCFLAVFPDSESSLRAILHNLGQCDRRYFAAIDLVFNQSSSIRHEKLLVDFHGHLKTL